MGVCVCAIVILCVCVCVCTCYLSRATELLVAIRPFTPSVMKKLVVLLIIQSAIHIGKYYYVFFFNSPPVQSQSFISDWHQAFSIEYVRDEAAAAAIAAGVVASHSDTIASRHDVVLAIAASTSDAPWTVVRAHCAVLGASSRYFAVALANGVM